MEAVAAAVGQGPVMRDFRRNVASTVVILTLGTLLIAGELQCWRFSSGAWAIQPCRQSAFCMYSGGADWSYRGVRSWVSNKGEEVLPWTAVSAEGSTVLQWRWPSFINTLLCPSHAAQIIVSCAPSTNDCILCPCSQYQHQLSLDRLAARSAHALGQGSTSISQHQQAYKHT